MKFVIIIGLLSNMLFGGTSLNISIPEQKELQNTLKKLYDYDKGEDSVINSLLYDKDVVVGKYKSRDYLHTYKIKASDRLAIFIIQEIYNENNSLVKKLGMKKGFTILVDANANPQVLFAGDMSSPHTNEKVYIYVQYRHSFMGTIQDTYINIKWNDFESKLTYDNGIFQSLDGCNLILKKGVILVLEKDNKDLSDLEVKTNGNLVSKGIELPSESTHRCVKTIILSK